MPLSAYMWHSISAKIRFYLRDKHKLIDWLGYWINHDLYGIHHAEEDTKKTCQNNSNGLLLDSYLRTHKPNWLANVGITKISVLPMQDHVRSQ